MSAEWPLIPKPYVVRCDVGRCPDQPWIDGVCKFHSDARYYCDQILGLKEGEYDLARFGR